MLTTLLLHLLYLFRYLEALLEYLEEYCARVKPLLDVNEVNNFEDLLIIIHFKNRFCLTCLSLFKENVFLWKILIILILTSLFQ